MKLLKQLAIAFCLSCLILLANTDSNVLAEELLPNLSGRALLKKIVDEYTPKETLGYDKGRDILYTKIDNKNGVLTGIYTSYSVNVSPDSNTPRQDAYRQDINAEHIYPQSKGAKGKAKSDLHSLFPSRVNVNSTRSSNPFAEINDSLTQKWFRDDQLLRSKPATFIDGYSESISNLFEPRENKKGDVARAMFYFYTIYHSQANARDPNFFPLQETTLCQWNRIDPVDDQELERSHLVAHFQGNENPFVIDATLVDRAYCQ